MTFKQIITRGGRAMATVLGVTALLLASCSTAPEEPEAPTKNLLGVPQEAESTAVPRGAERSVAPRSADGNAVTFDTLAEATIKISGQGTFLEPGTVDPVELPWQGSAFLIDPSGLAITNNHVVVGAGRLHGTYGQDGEHEASLRVLGASECLDLAVVQLNADELPYFQWYEGDITTGLDVYSAGFPEGAADEFTLTRGIVSKPDFEFDTQWASLDHVIEHDARIRGGNSGGPLLTADAEVLGVNYAGNDSLDSNFAIHREVVQDVFEAMSAGERISSLGINAQAWDGGDPALVGVWVSSVEAGGPADKAGIEPGDLIVKLGGVSVGEDGTLGSYCQVLDTKGTEATVDIEILRFSAEARMAGQINGRELAVTQANVFGGQVPQEAAEYSGATVDLVDESNSLAVSVPVEWGEVDGTSRTDEAGRSWASLAVAPDLDAFWGSLTVPGLWMLGTDPSFTPEAGLQQFDFSDSCTVTDSDVWDDGYYRGPYEEYDCDGSTLIVLASQDYEQTGTLILVIQVQSDYELTTVLAEIAGTFRFR